MQRRSRRRSAQGKRRTTLTLPADSLALAERVARTRQVNLSVVVAEALAEGLQKYAAAERSDQVLDAYRKAFGGLSDEQMALLDGVILKPVRKHRK